jgi:D-psicose/D-tagatose/L-ribulose 3-epimerase
MKYSMNLLLWTDTLSQDKLPILDKVKSIGFDAVELPMFDRDTVNAAVWGKAMDNLGFTTRSGTCAFGPDDHLISDDPKVRRHALDSIKQILDCCAAAGCSVMAGHATQALGIFTGKGPTKDEWNRALDGIREAAEHAGKVGVKIALEALNRFECYFLNCMADAKRFVKEVNHPSCGVMYDTFHANIEEKSSREAVTSVKDVLFHVHISESDRSTPGTGMVHWDETFDALHEVGYDGILCCEAFGLALPKLTAATKIWRRMYESEDQLAKDVLAFMKKHVDKRKK